VVRVCGHGAFGEIALPRKCLGEVGFGRTTGCGPRTSREVGQPVPVPCRYLSLVGPARDFNPLKSALWRAHQKKGPRRSDGGPKKNRGASQRMTIRPGE